MQAELPIQGPETPPSQSQSFAAESIPTAGDALQIVSALSRAQDQDDLEIQLTHVLRELLRPATSSLYRLMTYGGEPRVLLSVELRRGATKPLLARPWDPDALPKLAGRSDLSRCCAEQMPIQIPGATGRRPRALFPIFGASEVVGILELMLDRPLTSEQERLALLVLALYRNQLAMIDFAHRDTLTGLLNRKAFETGFAKLIATVNGRLHHDNRVPFLGRRRPPNENQHYWMAVLDIDHFRRINDDLGHLFGDEVLLLIARIMRTSFRVHDQLYRFGGEEFVIVLDRTEAENAKRVLERLRDKMEKYPFPQIPSVTISMGYTHIRDDDNPCQAYSRAVTALYYGKEHGRNQVHHYEELVEQGLIQPKPITADFELF